MSATGPVVGWRCAVCGTTVDVAVAHLASPDRAEQLAGRLAGRLGHRLDGREVQVGEIGAVLGDTTVRKQLISQGVTPGGSPAPDALKDYIRSQIGTWGDIARKAGVAGTI